MLRTFAVGLSAVVVTAALAVAPAAATRLPGAPAGQCADRVCLTAPVGTDPVVGDPVVTEFFSVRRNSSAPPPVAVPAPEPPSSPPDDSGSGPGGPGPGPGGGAPPPTAPPVETAGPPAVPDMTPATPPPAEPVPTTTPAPPEPRRPSEAVLPKTEPRLPKTAADSRPLAVLGGGFLVAAGLAWIGGAARRTGRV